MPRHKAKLVTNPPPNRIAMGLASKVMEHLPEHMTSRSPNAKERVSETTKRVLGAQGVKAHWIPVVSGQVMTWLDKR